MNFQKTIFTGFAPNLSKQDVYKSLKFLFLPGHWARLRQGQGLEKAEQWLKNYFNIKYAVLFDSGRSALQYAIESLGIDQGDEVIIQAYTCVVVVNAVKFAGAVPVYADIDKTLNINPDELAKKITKNTKAVIVQHTFGIPADLDKIRQICRENNIKLIEDCAHSLGADYKGQKVGTFGDAAILSFGSDKIVSCNRGGAVITNNPEINEKLSVYRAGLPDTPLIKIIQHLLHFPIFYIGKMSYSYFIGKAILFLSKKLSLISRIIYEPEKRGEQVDFYPAKMPNCLAEILLPQLENLDNTNKHRIKIAKLYQEKINNKSVDLPIVAGGAVYLRFNLLSNLADKLARAGKGRNIIFGDWYNTVVAPKDIDAGKTNYNSGSCPNAEKFSRLSINLPTDKNIGEREALGIAEIVNSL